jgi:hypothetical protein
MVIMNPQISIRHGILMFLVVYKQSVLYTRTHEFRHDVIVIVQFNITVVTNLLALIYE